MYRKVYVALQKSIKIGISITRKNETVVIYYDESGKIEFKETTEINLISAYEISSHIKNGYTYDKHTEEFFYHESLVDYTMCKNIMERPTIQNITLKFKSAKKRA